LIVGSFFIGCNSQQSKIGGIASEVDSRLEKKDSENRPQAASVVAPHTMSAVPMPIDFDQAIREVSFSMQADDNGAEGENGIPDSIEMALIAKVINGEQSLPKGLSMASARAAWEQAHRSATKDIASHLEKWPHLATLIAGYAMVGTQESFNAINKLAASFGTPLQSDYQLALELGKFFGPEGDADNDGFTNRQEYSVFGIDSRDRYLVAALDANIFPTNEQVQKILPPKKTRFNVGVILYEDFEVLDVYGPVEMWGNVPEFDLFTIAENKGPIRSAQGFSTIATYSFIDAPRIDIMLVPGGRGTMVQLRNPQFLEFLQARHPETLWTTSVCTGSALLAKAGILNDLKATSNKTYFSLAKQQSSRVQWIDKARWVDDGKVFTSSGVSAGTDMSLALIAKMFGFERAEMLAKQLEYQWHTDKNNDPFAIIEK
jgi:putative intracellular protease/amidase